MLGELPQITLIIIKILLRTRISRTQQRNRTKWAKAILCRHNIQKIEWGMTLTSSVTKQAKHSWFLPQTATLGWKIYLAFTMVNLIIGLLQQKTFKCTRTNNIQFKSVTIITMSKVNCIWISSKMLRRTSLLTVKQITQARLKGMKLVNNINLNHFYIRKD